MQNLLRVLCGLLIVGVVACDSANAEGETPEVDRPSPAAQPAPTSVAITVGASGYSPDSVEVTAGQPLTLVFTRTTDQGCGQEVVFPDQNIRRALPLNEAVSIELTPEADQRIAFTCGMGMMRGSIVASR